MSITSRRSSTQRKRDAAESTEKGRKMKELPAGRTRFDCQRAEREHNARATTRYYYIIRVKARTRCFFECTKNRLLSITSMTRTSLAILVAALAIAAHGQRAEFVRVEKHILTRNGRPYRFVGANYWYAPLLPLEKDPDRGIRRLRRELDSLKANGVINLRLMAGAEGSGLINGVTRVGPPLQPEQGRFDERVMRALDRALYEIGRRGMTAVIFLSNNWEWTGGFQQYLVWNGREPARFLSDKPTWDEYRDEVAKFYSCELCVAAYRKQVETVVSRTNSITGRRYQDDPAIMAWELANEPRPMRASANNAYRHWISESAALIRSLDKNHLISIGHEGSIGTEDVKLYEEINADPNIDYMTIHIWPKNWGWFTGSDLAASFPNILDQTAKYIDENAAVAQRLDKPLVIEEFGLPRDQFSFDPKSSTSFRDRYYAAILSHVAGQPGGNKYIAGANFWAFGGAVRPIDGQTFWKPGDQFTGDPPMEEQGLNTVFESDRSTYSVIRNTAGAIKSR